MATYISTCMEVGGDSQHLAITGRKRSELQKSPKTWGRALVRNIAQKNGGEWSQLAVPPQEWGQAVALRNIPPRERGRATQ
eukprot:4059445-Pyramimonas_sp.AAC.1